MASAIPMKEPCPCGSGDLYRDCCGRPLVVRARQRRNAVIAIVVLAVAAIPVVRYLYALDAERREAMTLPEGSYFSAEHKHWHGPDDEEILIPGYVWSMAQQKWLKVNEALIKQVEFEKERAESRAGGETTPIEERFTELPEPQTGVFEPKDAAAPEGQVWSERHGHYHDENGH